MPNWSVIARNGYRQFQIKVGADWVQDIDRIRATVPLLKPGEKAMADANQGWRVDNALRVARATRALDFIFEQPCRTYEECLQVRQRIDSADEAGRVRDRSRSRAADRGRQGR